MGLNFPSSPSLDELYPPTPLQGVPTYKWDGVKWKISAEPTGVQPSSDIPSMDGIMATAGIASTWSRGDHQHPYDIRYAPVASPTFTGTLTAQTFNVSGDIALGGKVVAGADGHHLGNSTAGGVGVNWDNITPAQANIIFYDFGSNNWAGIGVDQNGYFWIRTGAAASSNNTGFVAKLANVDMAGGVPFAPTPTAGDNTTKLATTAFVVANQPVGGPYLSNTGGTITGTLTINTGHIMSYRSGGTTGVMYLSNGDRYFYYDGTNYILGSVPLYTAAGRVWGSNDFTNPVTSARIGPHAGDYTYTVQVGLTEPYAGSVITGSSDLGVNGGHIQRHRYNQIYTNAWYTAGNV